MINKTFLGRLAISGCMALFLCISAAGTLEAAATIQEVVIENKADSSALEEITLKGKNLSDAQWGEWKLVSGETSTWQVEGKNVKMDKKAKVQGATIIPIGKDQIRIEVTTTKVQSKWGHQVVSYYRQKDKKAKRPQDELQFSVLMNSRPAFKPGNEMALKDRVIILDPGHGGKDVGAVGLGGTKEKDINLSVALKVRNELSKWGANPQMTREVDTFAMDELGDRVNYGLRKKGDIFVSLHSDAALNREAKGFTVYYYSAKGSDDLMLAKNLCTNLSKTMDTSDRGVRSANFYVVKRNPLPSVLIEMGFVSNPEEELRLSDSEYQQDLVEGIVQGLANYFNAQDIAQGKAKRVPV